MEKKIARIISWAFHPLLMPLYGLIIIFNLKIYSAFSMAFSVKILMLVMVFFSCVMFPVILMAILYRTGRIRSVYLATREERIYPFLGTMLAYYITYYLLSRTGIPALYPAFFLAATLLAAVFLLSSLRWKPSIHTGGMGALTALVLAVSLRLSMGLVPPVCALLFLAGVIATARLRLNAHSPAEVYAGFFIGFAVFGAAFMLM